MPPSKPPSPPPSPTPASPPPDAHPVIAAALPEGYRLDGYQLLALLASTSSSLTYLATDLELGLAVTVMEYFPAALARRDEAGGVALSELRHAELYQQGLLAFAEEARVLARCQHPSLTHVQRLWHGHGSAYRVMPYREGQPLLSLRREMPGPPDEASLLALMDDLLDALDTFHRSGHVHGGVHPGNILLLADDRPLLLGPDWAAATLARATAGSAVTAELTGFAPREQLSLAPGAAPGAAIDLYALSEVVRFCIGGELPAPTSARRLGAATESVLALVKRRFGHDPRVRYGLPLLRTLDAATSTRPQQRPVDVSQYRAWLSDGPPEGRPGSVSAPARAPLLTPNLTPTPIPTPPPVPPPTATLTPPPADPAPIFTFIPTEPEAPPAEPLRPLSPAAAPAASAEQDDANAFLTPEFFARLTQANEDGAAAEPAAPELAAEAPTPTPAPAPAPAAERASRERLEPSLAANPPAPAAALAAERPDAPRFELPPRGDYATPPRRRPVVFAAVTLAVLAAIGVGAWQAGAINLPGAEEWQLSHLMKSRQRAGAPPTVPAASAAANLERAEALLAQTPAPASSRAAPPAMETPLPTEPTAAGPSAAAPAEEATPEYSSAPLAREPRSGTNAANAANAAARTDTPRSACGTRTEFSLYRCLQTQCAQKRWQGHAQCAALKRGETPG